MQEEIWKDIPGYEGLYHVSNLGDVKSLNYKKSKTEKLLKLAIASDGYFVVGLYKDSKSKQYKVHKLVAMAFLNHIPCGYEVVCDHKNDVKTDNRLENLQLVTARFNTCKTQGKYSSKYKGVSWHKRSRKWMSRIIINGKLNHLGSFNCELSASLAYQNKLKELI
jgi:hypothetical protein